MSDVAEKTAQQAQAYYEIGWRIVGRTTIAAASPEEAQAKFDQLSAERMIAEGYDDIEVDEPERKEPKR